MADRRKVIQAMYNNFEEYHVGQVNYIDSGMEKMKQVSASRLQAI